MSAGDDDHDDDGQLKQLRAVWVSMRDEDPPDRGLAALMTAAREKASELSDAARPSWWKRMAATLMRPPVLALATVTLLLGGALIVTQRGSQMKADSVMTTETDDMNQMSDMPKGGAAEPSGVTPVNAGSSATIGTVADQERAPAVEVVAPDPPKLREPKPGKAKAAATAKPSPDPVNPVQPPPAEPPPTNEAGPRGVTGGGAAPPLSIARDEDPATAESAPRDDAATVKQPPKKPIARTAPPEIEGEDRVTTKDSAKTPPAIEQLVKQCETAAARGDCAAVRVIAQKILTSSPSVYKARVANNSALHKCLPSDAPNAASK